MRSLSLFYQGPSHCTLPMGLESGFLRDANFTSSSDYGPNNVSSNARLHSVPSDQPTRAWSSQINDMNQWIRVDFGEAVKITGIATQGLQGSDNWVKSYNLSHSNDGVNFTAYAQVLWYRYLPCVYFVESHPHGSILTLKWLSSISFFPLGTRQYPWQKKQFKTATELGSQLLLIS